MNTTTSSTSKRKNTSSFQDLSLFFQDVEIIHHFNVYCTTPTSIFFHLKKQQCDNIKQNTKNLFLRVCKNVNTDKNQKDFLPKSISISINGCYFNLSSKSKEPNWKTPLDITSRCRIVTTRNANKIDICLNNYKQFIVKGFGLEIVLARRSTIGDQLQLLKTDKYIRKTEDTLKLIKENCSAFEDLECETIRVPLTCSVTKKIIQTPLCGKKCKHISCFEAQTFLEMMLNQPEWVCTVCNNVIRKSDLVRDPFIEDILKSTQRSIDLIEFDKLGNYKAAKQENKRNKKKSKEIECITLDNELGNSNLDNNNLNNNNFDNNNLNINNFGNNFTIDSSIDVNLSNNFTTPINTNLLIPKLEILPFFSQHHHLMNNSDFFNSIGLNSFTNNRTNRTSTNNRNNTNNDDDIISLSDNSCIVLDSDDEPLNPTSSNTILSESSQNTIINNNLQDNKFNTDDTSNSDSFIRLTTRKRNISSSSDSESESDTNLSSNSTLNSSLASSGYNRSNTRINNSTSEDDSDNNNSISSNSEHSSMSSSSNVSDSDSLSSLNSNDSITSNTSLSSGSNVNNNKSYFSTPLLQSRTSLRRRHKRIRR